MYAKNNLLSHGERNRYLMYISIGIHVSKELFNIKLKKVAMCLKPGGLTCLDSRLGSLQTKSGIWVVIKSLS